MPFFLGVITGILVADDDLSHPLMLVLLPFFFAALGLIGWGAYEAVIWFDASRASWQPTAWYDWPWHWPGAHLAEQLFMSLTPRASPADAGATSMVIDLIGKLPKAMLAIGINLVIAMFPIVLISQSIRVGQKLSKGNCSE